MQFNNKSYKKETVDEIVSEMKNNPYGDKPIINGGYPIFNQCGHTTIDMSTLIDENKENDMHTLSIKLADDSYITLCVMPMFEGNYINVDVKMHSNTRKNHAIHFGKIENNRKKDDDSIIKDFNLMALISELK